MSTPAWHPPDPSAQPGPSGVPSDRSTDGQPPYGPPPYGQQPYGQDTGGPYPFPPAYAYPPTNGRRRTVPVWIVVLLSCSLVFLAVLGGLTAWGISNGTFDEAGGECAGEGRDRADRLAEDDLMADYPADAEVVDGPEGGCDETGSYAGEAVRIDGDPERVIEHYREVGPDHSWSVQEEWKIEPGFALLCLQKNLDDGTRAYATVYLDEVDDTSTSFSLELTSAEHDLDACSEPPDAGDIPS